MNDRMNRFSSPTLVVFKLVSTVPCGAPLFYTKKAAEGERICEIIMFYKGPFDLNYLLPR